MTAKCIRLFIVVFLLAPIFPVGVFAQDSMSDWQKGVIIESRWTGDFSSASFKQSVDNLVAIHANYVTLVFRLYQSNLSSTDIQKGGDTPDDQSLAAAIDYIHSKGMKVMIKPHLESMGWEWRAKINPNDRQTWFTNYDNFIIHYAQIAQAHGAEDFCVGTELISTSSTLVDSTNTQNWKNLISQVRTKFAGKLTYSANWGETPFSDEKNHIDFWDSLDYIGISAYYSFHGDGSADNINSQWDAYNKNDITPLSQKWNKPVVFTEIGYRSVTNAHTAAWNYELSGSYDAEEQANDFAIMFGFWQNQSFMKGVQIWGWSSDPNAGGSGETGYTIQHKPAEAVVSQWFGSGVVTPPPPSNTATFSSTASVSPSTVNAGQTANISLNVTANGGQAAGIIVDAEIYNSSGQRVKQQIFDNQAFTNGETKIFNMTYAPPTNGTYKVKIGVFNYNWSQVYNWNDNAASFGSGSTPPPPPPPPTTSTLDIWWPSNGSTVSGIQPFKAMLNNMAVTQYAMYWQVDGDTLVLMRNDNTDYPHKQFDVDLSHWNWHGSGPYRINFVAKDLGGKVIAQKAIDINIGH